MKKYAPATLRNRDAIAAILVNELPKTGTVLEIASGSGEHAVYFAPRLPDLVWQPSDPSGGALLSIEAWRSESRANNLRAPIRIDASSEEWPINYADALVCINMVHISPWEATQGLFAGANRILPKAAPLILYGPYIEVGVETAPSNMDFDASLRSRDARWGLRHVADVDELAANKGFARVNRYEMPANNIALIYRRAIKPV